MAELSPEGQEALVVYIDDCRDEWIARYGETSWERYRGNLVPAWTAQALALFSEQDLIEMASPGGGSIDPSDGPP